MTARHSRLLALMGILGLATASVTALAAAPNGDGTIDLIETGPAAGTTSASPRFLAER